MVSSFLKLFGKSPFKSLLDHMEIAYECARELAPFFEATMNNDWEKATTIQETIAELENKADDGKRNIRLNLPKDMFLPVARGDLLELVSHQDRLANTAEDIAGIVLGRKMAIPEPITETFIQFIDRSIEAAKQAYKAVRELNDLFDSGFSGQEASFIQEMVESLHVVEHDTDELQIKLRSALFQLETSLPPVNVMFLYKLFSIIGQLADHAQKIGDRLQICIAR